MADEKKAFKIKASAGSPDEVAMGNLLAVKKDEHYETTHSRFAEFLEVNFADTNKAETMIEPEPQKKKEK